MTRRIVTESDVLALLQEYNLPIGAGLNAPLNALIEEAYPSPFRIIVNPMLLPPSWGINPCAYAQYLKGKGSYTHSSGRKMGGLICITFSTTKMRGPFSSRLRKLLRKDGCAVIPMKDMPKSYVNRPANLRNLLNESYHPRGKHLSYEKNGDEFIWRLDKIRRA